MEKPLVALCMIVKNESKVLKRCLDSVKPFVDFWVIVDTGSTDDTIETIYREMSGIPGELHRKPWVNFGTNRSELLSLAKNEAKWLLLLDADMTIQYQDNFLPWLSEVESVDGFRTWVKDGSLTYRLPLLVSGDKDWKSVGATHEYLSGPGNMLDLEGFNVVHHSDGSSRPEKHSRDIALLKPEFDKGDPRATYYTAQAYECLGDWRKAVELYDKRVSLGGWDEEVWHATYRAGDITLKFLDFDEGADRLLAAWRMRPHRAEPLNALKNGVVRRGPKNDLLFLEKEVYG